MAQTTPAAPSTLDDRRHLLRRLAFTATPAAEHRLDGLSAGDALAALVAGARSAPVPGPPPALDGVWTNTALRTPGMTDADYDARRLAQTRAHGRAIEELRQWWLQEIVAGPAPLRENLVLFFQGYFGSSIRSVDVPHALHGTNALLRRACLGTVPALMEQLVLDPAMLIQIGMDEHDVNRVSDRAAMLILERWTVGAGAYTPGDVEELSRALTGWALDAPAGADPGPAPDPAAPRAARRTGLVPRFDRHRFDAGPKTILGATREFDAQTAVGFLARHPSTARRVGRHLLRHLGVVDAGGRLEDQLAATYRESDGSVEALLRQIVQSEAFWADASRWTLVKSPVHLVAGACRQLEIASPPLDLVSRWLTSAGQTLFDTPSPDGGGWPEGNEWLTPPDRLAVRYGLADVLSGRMPPLGLQTAGSAAEPPAMSGLGPALRREPAQALVARLDPSPGLDVPAGDPADPGALARRVIATPHYQLA